MTLVRGCFRSLRCSYRLVPKRWLVCGARIQSTVPLMLAGMWCQYSISCSTNAGWYMVLEFNQLFPQCWMVCGARIQSAVSPMLDGMWCQNSVSCSPVLDGMWCWNSIGCSSNAGWYVVPEFNRLFL